MPSPRNPPHGGRAPARQRDPDTSQLSHQMTTAASSQSRPTTRRLPSSGVSGWGRLRAPQTDPLEAYGLVSKGDTRLNDPKLQESFYRLIVDRYMALCSSSGPNLSSLFASMSLSPSSQSLSPTPKPTSTGFPSSTTTISPASTGFPSTTPADLPLLLSAMRKLRESLTSTGRTDTFAQRAYLFILRATLLMRNWEAYLPALNALLGRIHGITPLPASELRDVVGYRVLDLACRTGDLRGAIEERARWRGKGVKLGGEVEGVLQAVLRDDWLGWRREEGRVDGYVRALMEGAQRRMRVHVLKVLGRAYLRIEVGVLEEWAGEAWEGLVKEGVGWEREGSMVVVRKVKGK
ncbi:hypothetical protein K461DRAFT_319954 [Myriangium duriaei CBS 260.36]|uniref:CSN8/PSMD8/EIF3K domain-containing protein n=1 Tax=Myriangium duriaei CBS 260.36 TaxID=1168546 RepID=A0A9P4J1F1_9PEZI|nr:hypothetical protein K461DRAFT_319954 [Myriangium duriaei CBS 260.36]